MPSPALPDEPFLSEAIHLAHHSVATGGGPFGAVVVRAGEIVGRGHNRVTADRDPTAHAELLAIRDACHTLGDFRLDGCTLYSSAEPCPMCLAAAHWARLERIVYAAPAEAAAGAGFDDQLIHRELCLPPERRRLPMAQTGAAALIESAHAVFAAWGAQEEKIPY